jgi:hypothetical protein
MPSNGRISVSYKSHSPALITDSRLIAPVPCTSFAAMAGPSNTTDEIGALRQRRNLHPFGDAADLPNVGLDIIHGFGPNVVPEFEAVAELLAERDRNPAMRAHMRVTRDVVGEQRLLDEGGRDVGQRAAALHRFARGPLLVDVEHQLARADELAHRAAAVEVLVRIRAADLQLEGRVALAEMVLGLAQQLLLGQVQVDRAGIDADRGPRAAKQPMERLAGMLGLDVPKRDVDRRERERCDSTWPGGMARPIAAARCARWRIVADQERREVGVDQRPRGERRRLRSCTSRFPPGPRRSRP